MTFTEDYSKICEKLTNLVHFGVFFECKVECVYQGKFVNKIGSLSEKKNHHADIYIGWCEVKVYISSHDMGGVTTKCINLAMDISFIND